MTFRDRVYGAARRVKRRVLLPEIEDARVAEAGREITSLGLGEVLPVEPAGTAPAADLVAWLRQRRPDRFPDDATARMALAHPLVRGACLVGLKRADVMVGGAVHPTGELIRAALLGVGTAPGIEVVSSAFYMVKGETVLTFTDCAVMPDPTAAQLAEIAWAAARDRRRIVGDEPRIAFLSYSTKGCAGCTNERPTLCAMVSCRGMRPLWRTSGGARRRIRPSPVTPTFWCSPILTAATSPTNWCSV
jgi:phosphate acetyltransferase